MAEDSEFIPEKELGDEELEDIAGSGRSNTVKPGGTINKPVTQDMYLLQNLMEQKGQLEQMVTNVIKSSSQTSDGITGNLKA